MRRGKIEKIDQHNRDKYFLQLYIFEFMMYLLVNLDATPQDVDSIVDSQKDWKIFSRNPS